MRVFVLLVGLIAFPLAASAQDTTIITTPPVAGSGAVGVTPEVPAIAPRHSLSEAVPQPRLHAEVSTYRVAAIATGAVAGVIVANAITGGMITPILMYGSGNGAGAALMASSYTAAATHTLVTAAGAIGGGYIANWIYGE